MASPETVSNKDVSSRLKAEPARFRAQGLPQHSICLCWKQRSTESPAFLSIPLAGLINLLRTVLPISGRVHGMTLIGERHSINICQ